MARQSEFRPDYEAMTKAQLIEALRLLDEALEAMPEGFVLYDEDGRLCLCNSLFRDTYPWARDLVRPGVAFEELVRAGVTADAYPDRTWTCTVAELDASQLRLIDVNQCARSSIVIGSRWSACRAIPRTSRERSIGDSRRQQAMCARSIPASRRSTASPVIPICHRSPRR